MATFSRDTEVALQMTCRAAKAAGTFCGKVPATLSRVALRYTTVVPMGCDRPERLASDVVPYSTVSPYTLYGVGCTVESCNSYKRLSCPLVLRLSPETLH
jgi:hypothetical protein